jgi:hypothetical protein
MATPVGKSARNAGAATNMMKKVQSLAVAKNLELPPATCTDADFSILPPLSDSLLYFVVVDSGIVSSKGTLVEAFDVVRGLGPRNGCKRRWPLWCPQGSGSPRTSSQGG